MVCLVSVLVVGAGGGSGGGSGGGGGGGGEGPASGGGGLSSGVMVFVLEDNVTGTLFLIPPAVGR